MDGDADEEIEFQSGEFGGRGLWRAGAALLGASLWAQLFWYPLAGEFLSGQAGLVYVATYVLPTLALFVALISDEAAGYVFFVPGSLLPGLVLLPDHIAAGLLQPHRAAMLAVTLVAFVFAGAFAVRDESEPRDGDDIEKPPERVDGLYSSYTTIRVGILVVLFGVLVGTGIVDGSLIAAIGDHYDTGRVAAQTFIVVTGFFVWCVVAYTMFFVPAANIEYDLRSLSREIDAMAESRAGVRRHLGWTVGLGGAAVALLFSLEFVM